MTVCWKTVTLTRKSERLQGAYIQCRISLARFRGINRVADFSDNRQYWGNSFQLLRRGESFLADHIPIPGRVVPGKMVREDYPLYPPRATREALANALCHRDYTAIYGDVKLAMYDDHLEIISPGGLHFGMTFEKLGKSHESKPWNPLIADIFFKAGIIERWGTGTLNMLDWCKENGNPAPEWSERTGFTVVTFWPHTHLRLESRLESIPIENQTSLREKIVQILKEYGPLSRRQIALQLGHKGISGELNKQLKILFNEKEIEFTIPEKTNSRHQKYKLRS